MGYTFDLKSLVTLKSLLFGHDLNIVPSVIMLTYLTKHVLVVLFYRVQDFEENLLSVSYNLLILPTQFSKHLLISVLVTNHALPCYGVDTRWYAPSSGWMRS